MKKYLYAGLLTACLTAPAFAANSKAAPRTPEEPLHRRTIALCVAMLVGLHAYKHRPLAKRHEVLGHYK